MMAAAAEQDSAAVGPRGTPVAEELAEALRQWGPYIHRLARRFSNLEIDEEDQEQVGRLVTARNLEWAEVDSPHFEALQKTWLSKRMIDEVRKTHSQKRDVSNLLHQSDMKGSQLVDTGSGFFALVTDPDPVQESGPAEVTFEDLDSDSPEEEATFRDILNKIEVQLTTDEYTLIRARLNPPTEAWDILLDHDYQRLPKGMPMWVTQEFLGWDNARFFVALKGLKSKVYGMLEVES